MEEFHYRQPDATSRMTTNYFVPEQLPSRNLLLCCPHSPRSRTGTVDFISYCNCVQLEEDVIKTKTLMPFRQTNAASNGQFSITLLPQYQRDTGLTVQITDDD